MRETTIADEIADTIEDETAAAEFRRIEDKLALEQMLGSLTEAEFRVLRASLTYERAAEAAASVGMTRGSYAVALYRARARLKQQVLSGQVAI